MFEFLHHIHYQPQYMMHKTDTLLRRLMQKKSRVDVYCKDDRKVLDLQNDSAGEKEDAEDIKLEGIDVAT